MIPLATVPSQLPANIPTGVDDALVLRERMIKTRRHRLPHGYPLAAAMPRVQPNDSGAEVVFDPNTKRGLLVGVLPHPFCNPAVTGCGNDNGEGHM